MNLVHTNLITALYAVAAFQIFIALLNLGLEQIMGWQQEMAQMPLLIREVHRVHAWFISASVGIFGVLTWRFAAALAAGNDPVCVWLAAATGIFWGIRTVLQVTYYSASHWRGQPGRTVIHIILLLVYGGMTGVYLWSAFRARA